VCDGTGQGRHRHAFDNESSCEAFRQDRPVSKVSQARMSPALKPARNQRTRWAELPWVKLSEPV
jgi:hypothetical protein